MALLVVELFVVATIFWFFSIDLLKLCILASNDSDSERSEGDSIREQLLPGKSWGHSGSDGIIMEL